MPSTAPHIVLVCSRLDLPGGIERAVVSLANLLSSKKKKVSLLILDEISSSFYPISPAVEIIQQPLLFGITEKGNPITRKISFIKDIKKLKQTITALDASIIIATDYQFIPALILAGVNKKSKVYSWEHHEYTWLKKNTFWKTLLNYSYPKLDGIICLNETEAAYNKKFATPIVIPNFIESSFSDKADLHSKTILSIGWLIPRKGIDMMMVAAKEVFKKHPDWKWKIIGDGEMKNELLDFIKTEKLEHNLILQKPNNHNLTQEYAKASIFVLASRIEVFGLVLPEAMSHSLPCISFDCPSGPANIITHNVDGLLVENENANELAKAISTLIDDDKLRQKLGENAFQSSFRYSAENIYKQWEEKIFT